MIRIIKPLFLLLSTHSLSHGSVDVRRRNAGEDDAVWEQCQQASTVLLENSQELHEADQELSAAVKLEITNDYSTISLALPQDAVDKYAAVCEAQGGKVKGIAKDTLDCTASVMGKMGITITYNIENLVECLAPICPDDIEDIMILQMQDQVSALGHSGLVCNSIYDGYAPIKLPSSAGDDEKPAGVRIFLIGMIAIGVIGVVLLVQFKRRQSEGISAASAGTATNNDTETDFDLSLRTEEGGSGTLA